MSSVRTSSSKLVAILFADIQGYTALMQKNQSEAAILLRRFQSELNAAVSTFDGRIVNFYGDGALSVFETPEQATRCAMLLHAKYTSDPVIPVRLGIHSGPVVFEGDKVFGNSVNVASRVESMGVPGAVLLSDRVRQDIKNQPDISVERLGSFTFKNVEEPMAVYAVANDGFVIPKSSDLKGKLDTKRFSKLKYLLPAIALLGILAFALWHFLKEDDLLPSDIRESRIAVLPFENKTNDVELDILGDMAADWIIEGLMNLDDIKVVSFQSAKSNIQYASFGEGESVNSLFGKITGAEKIVQGKIYKLNNDLVFQSSVLDATSGEVEFVFPKIEGNENDISSIIGNLQNRVLSFFALKDDAVGSLFIDKPPKYEAYKEFTIAGDFFGVDDEKAREYYNKAIEIDSSFFFPYGSILTTYGNSGNYAAADSMLQIIDSRFKEYNHFEKLNIDWARATINRDIQNLVISSRKLHELDPKNHMFNYLAGYYEANINNPKKAIAIFEHIDTSILDKLVTSSVTSWWNEVYAHCLIQENRLGEAEDILNKVPEQYRSKDDYQLLAQLFVYTDRENEIENLINKLEEEGRSPAFMSSVYNAASIASNLQGDHESQIMWGKRSAEYLNSQPESSDVDNYSLAESYFHQGAYQRALPLYAALSSDNVSGSVYSVGLWHHLSRQGVIYAKLGEDQKARNIIKRLKAVDDPTPSGRYTYGIARIQAQLGQTEEAITSMRKAMNEGFVNEYAEFRYKEDVDFEPLRGNEAFDNFALRF